MPNYFKSYDIRGKYKIDFDERDAYKIGFFLPKLMSAEKILVGRDGRISSPALFRALCEGITDSGADVASIGVVTTPMVYYFTDKYGYKASIQITASHNSKEYNGFKISGEGAKPVGYDNGLDVLERMVENEIPVPAAKRGNIAEFDVKQEYIDFMKSKMPDISGLKIAVDGSNGAACGIMHEIFGDSVIYINDVTDGKFPAHNPNPLEECNTKQLKETVKAQGADIGIIFDGDGDRVAFVDENGRYISPDLMIAVIAEECITEKGQYVLHDIRTSWSVSEYVRKLGAIPVIWKVGHVHAKKKMSEIGATVGGELAGHYYFKEFMNCDSGILAAIKVLTHLVKSGKKMSEIVDGIVKYVSTGEVNFEIKQKDEAAAALVSWAKETEKPTKIYDFDGYRIEYDDWWFNVRRSNTEDFLRIVVEAKNTEILEEKYKKIKEIINSFTA